MPEGRQRGAQVDSGGGLPNPAFLVNDRERVPRGLRLRFLDVASPVTTREDRGRSQSTTSFSLLRRNPPGK